MLVTVILFIRFVDKSVIIWTFWFSLYLNNTINLRPLIPRIMPCYTHKMAIVSWPRFCDLTSAYVKSRRTGPNRPWRKQCSSRKTKRKTDWVFKLECNISEFPKGLRIEMTMKMGFPMGMGIRLQRGNGNGKECEWQQMGMEITCILMGEILTDFFYWYRLPLGCRPTWAEVFVARYSTITGIAF